MTLLKFLCSTLACVALLAGTTCAQAADREHYDLQTFSLDPAKLARMDEYLSKAYIPALKRAGAGPVGVFRQTEEKGETVVHVLAVFPSAEAARESSSKLGNDEEWTSATQKLMPAEVSRTAGFSLFAAIDGMPQLAKPDTTKPRILNLRIYESPTPEAHAKKVEMFNTGELAIFQRVGLTPVMFGSALEGPRMPNLTYLLVFPDDEARKAAWKKFGADPEWQALKAKPGYSDKEIIRKITNILLTPAPYSEI